MNCTGDVLSARLTNINQTSKREAFLMIKFLFAAVTALFVAAGAANAQVNLSGTGTVKAKPDMAHVVLAVVNDGKTAAEATQANSKAMTALCEAVEGCKVEKKDIRTIGFHLSPKYTARSDDGNYKVIGYTAGNSLQVTVRRLDDLGTLLDKAIIGGANRVEGIRWDVSDRAPLFVQARKNAFADAEAKARLYADAGCFTLGLVKSLTEEANWSDQGVQLPYFRPQMASDGGASARPPVPTSPGEIQFQVRVNVIWEMVPDAKPRITPVEPRR